MSGCSPLMRRYCCIMAVVPGRSGEGRAVIRTASTASSPSQPEDALRVAMEDLFHHLVLVAELAPFPEDTVVRHARVVAAEHDLVLQPAAHVDLEVAGEMLRRPARHLPVDVALVQRHRRRLVDPRPA